LNDLYVLLAVPRNPLIVLKGVAKPWLLPARITSIQKRPTVLDSLYGKLCKWFVSSALEGRLASCRNFRGGTIVHDCATWAASRLLRNAGHYDDQPKRQKSESHPSFSGDHTGSDSAEK
jgi:hypothetical protein